MMNSKDEEIDDREFEIPELDHKEHSQRIVQTAGKTPSQTDTQ
jgi:hypothetical protein